MITLPNVPAYSFTRAQKKQKMHTTPGPADYNWDLAKQKLLKKSQGVVFSRSKLSRFNTLNYRRDSPIRE